jgi:hypothetical protein
MKVATDRSAAALAIVLLFVAAPVHPQDQATVHRMAAQQYEVPGLVEEAVAEWIKVLALSPQDAEARGRVDALVRKQMPMWLPEEAERAAPFQCEVLRWEWPSATAGSSLQPDRPPQSASTKTPAEQGVQQRFLVTAVEFAAREGERWDELHETGFPHIDYGYMWSRAKRRYEVRVVAHWEEPAQRELAQAALRATLVFYSFTREQLGFDPTRPWGDPVDVWVTNKGEPGARAQGSSIYLYAAKTERAPGEWLRELAHEYGHVSFPGIGGFTATDDPWADGDLAELLFAKWLAEERAPDWMPWSLAEWEAEAKAERARLTGLWREEEARELIGQETRSCPTSLVGADAVAKEAFLGLALRVEEMKGPRFLGEVLKKCPRGTAGQFVGALGKERDAGKLLGPSR